MTFLFQQLGMALLPEPRNPVLLVAPLSASSAVPGMILALPTHFLQLLGLEESFFLLSLKKKKVFVFIF